jgi:hypothetical protein
MPDKIAIRYKGRSVTGPHPDRIEQAAFHKSGAEVFIWDQPPPPKPAAAYRLYDPVEEHREAVAAQRAASRNGNGRK